ncbi:PLP-dependent aminotransferase family protein [Nitrospirillum viridazoti]|uniref:GntR family transcriptional regulator/MocR family aminotransferase n=3 Tax=Nitrospirillum TaxID=1543705 RepID=A0A560IWG8_9PROT|nr:PLP-dependent aminotransferase family protein [Nitrospirillum amazonense]TWB63256.1 GntR family transcriptional regulator/MocR family aminotransferase [Nitrospirillum amazonense]
MKSRRGPLLTLTDGGEGGSLQQRLFDRLRHAIATGVVAPGERLPSTRTLARDMGLSRNTAVAAIERLTAEGYLESRVGSGTFVVENLPPDYAPAEVRAPSPRAQSPAPVETALPSPTLPFRPGIAAGDQLDIEAWRRVLSRSWRSLSARALERDSAPGWRPLRVALASFLEASRGLRCHPDQILILPGRAAALDLAVGLAASPGDRVWTEDPGCPLTQALVRRLGMTPVPVPADADGLDPAKGVALAPDARLAVVTANCQMPLGTVMSLERRQALLDWAARADAHVIEDDGDGGFTFETRPPATLISLDRVGDRPGNHLGDRTAQRNGRVLHVGGFERILYPGLRIAYLVVPEHLLERALEMRALFELHAPVVEQSALAEFIDEGHLASHLRRSRLTYQERRETLIDAARRLWAGALTLTPAAAGLQMAAKLADGLTLKTVPGISPTLAPDMALRQAARARSIDVTPLSSFHASRGGTQGLVLGYAAFPPPLILRAAQRLAETLEAHAGGTACAY